MDHPHIDTIINLADTVKSTLGPKGMNKLVITSIPIMTNDGATIIKNLKHPHPLFSALKNLASSQEETVGDGTTTTCILLAELLRGAKVLIEKGMHPVTIIDGYNLCKHALINHLNSNHLEPDLKNIILTTFGSKIDREFAKQLSDLIEVEMEIYSQKGDPSAMKVNGYAFDGFTINDQMPKEAEGKIAILNLRPIIESSKVEVHNAKDLMEVENYKHQVRKDIVDKLIESNVQALFTNDTDEIFNTLLTKANIMTVWTGDLSKLVKIAKSCGGTISTHVEDGCIGEGKVIFEKNPNRVYIESDKSTIRTLIFKSPTEQTIEEVKLSIHDVQGVLKSTTGQVYGGGAIEMQLSKMLRENMSFVNGKEQIAVEKYAEALESIPMTLAKNCGFDQIDILSKLRVLHNKSNDMGVDPVSLISSARSRNLVEPVNVKISAINNATELANLVLKMDDIYQGENENEKEKE